jgi:hypothetical protein
MADPFNSIMQGLLELIPCTWLDLPAGDAQYLHCRSPQSLGGEQKASAQARLL